MKSGLDSETAILIPNNSWQTTNMAVIGLLFIRVE